MWSGKKKTFNIISELTWVFCFVLFCFATCTVFSCFCQAVCAVRLHKASFHSSKHNPYSTCKMRFLIEPLFPRQGHYVLLLSYLHFIKWSFCAVWSWPVPSTCSGHCVPSSLSPSFRPLSSMLFHATAECHGLEQANGAYVAEDGTLV